MSSLCLVTGGAGFIGSHLVESLVRAGARVRVIDDLSTGQCDNLASVLPNIEFIKGDLSDPAAAELAVAGVDNVFHLAALPSVQRSVDDPLSTHQASATATLQLLNAARKAKVRRIVYAASSSVYGGLGNDEGQHEDQLPNPRSPYAAGKLAGEMYARAFAFSYGLETVCLRLFNVFGPRQRADSAYSGAVPRFCVAMLNSQSPMIHGDGRQSRDFTFVANAVGAFIQAASAQGISGNVYNIGTGTSISLLDIVACLNRLLQTNIIPKHGPAKPGDVHKSKADVRRAQRDLRYKVSVSFADGLERTLAWYRAFGSQSRRGQAISAEGSGFSG